MNKATYRVRGPSALVGAAVALWLTLWPCTARSQPASSSVESCMQDHELAQVHEKSGELLRSRSELRRCATPSCPALIQADCAEWLTDLTEYIPTVIPAARADGEDVRDVLVVMDGKLLVGSLDGRPIDVDPGVHTFVFRRTGAPPIETKKFISPRVKAQHVTVTWASSAPSKGAPAASVTAREGSEPRRGMSVGRVAGWTMLGLTVAAVGLGTTAGVVMFNARTNARAACPGNLCDASGLDDIAQAKTAAMLADVAFGTAVATAGVGAYLLLRHEPDEASAPRIAFRPVLLPQQGGLSLQGRFW